MSIYPVIILDMGNVKSAHKIDGTSQFIGIFRFKITKKSIPDNFGTSTCYIKCCMCRQHLVGGIIFSNAGTGYSETSAGNFPGSRNRQGNDTFSRCNLLLELQHLITEMRNCKRD